MNPGVKDANIAVGVLFAMLALAIVLEIVS